jgi:lipoyl(octanoyl) transferase
LQNQPKVKYKNLGIINYKEAWDYQEKLFAEVIQQKMVLRETTQPLVKSTQTTDHYLLMCEHSNVYTLGKSGHENNLLINDNFLQSINATYFKINRGGDITYHGPGQLVIYPILDLVKSYLYDIDDEKDLIDYSYPFK